MKNYRTYKSASGFLGPYLLMPEEIRRAGSNPGAYLLASCDYRGKLVIRYVGRSDGKLSDRLRDYVGQGFAFYYRKARSADEAFELECNEFHRYGKAWYLDNEIHPRRPEGSTKPPCSKRGCKGEKY